MKITDKEFPRRLQGFPSPAQQYSTKVYSIML